MKRGIILSDLHCGNIGGLTHPDYMRADLKEVQKTFYDWFLDHIVSYAPFDFVLGLGDFTDGEGKKGTLDTILPDVRDQAKCAVKILKDTGMPPDKWFLVRGTPFHSNGAMEYEDTIAELTGCSIKDVQKLDIEGWKIHTRHVVGRSDTAYGEGTPLLKELARVEHEAFTEKKEAPDIVIRGHVHYALQIVRNGRMAIDSPCLCLPIASGNGRRYTAWNYTVGFGVIELEEKQEPIYRCVKMPMRLIHEENYECVKW